MMQNVFKSLLIAGVCLPLGIVQCFAAHTEDKIQLEKEYEQQLKRDEDFKKANPEIYNKLKQQAQKARLNAYQKAAEAKPEQSIPAFNPPECKYYSTEGVCTLPRTIITPFPKIAHVNTVLNFKFPKQLGDCVAQYIDVYPKSSGYTIRYEKKDVIINIFIYDMPISMYKKELQYVDQLSRTARQIQQLYPNAVLDEKIWENNFADGDKFLYFYAQFAEENTSTNSSSNRHSYAMIFSKNQKFIKFRITGAGYDRKSFEQFVNTFIKDFDQNVIVESQSRKRKFDNSIIYPIVSYQPVI